jgi:hypothetical protein
MHADENENSTSDFSAVKKLKIVFSLAHNKVPGLDGFHGESYKFF